MTSTFYFSYNRNSAYANGLAAHGHNVTVLSPDSDKNAPNGVHYIQMMGLYNEYYDAYAKSVFVPREMNAYEISTEFFDFMEIICKGS